MVCVVLVVLGVTLVVELIAIPEIEQQLALADKEVQQMGICVIGAGGPCNEDTNWDHTH